MKKWGFLTGACVMLAFLSCGKDRINVSAVQFSEDKVLVEGKPFTGDIWSDDGATYTLTADQGEVVAFTLYHSNGQVALSKASHADSTLVYDEQGTPITIDTFATRYKELSALLTQLVKQIKGNQ
jgi:hypothetical protein